MKLSELIRLVGDDNIKFQNLNNDAWEVSKNKRGTKISFYTDGITAEEMLQDPNTSENIGLVIWLPRKQVDSIMAVAKVEK